jgi:hypothetical protein
VALPDSSNWQPWEQPAGFATLKSHFVAWRFTGQGVSDARGDPQTLLSGWNDDAAIFALWIGLRGPEQRLCLLMSRAPGRSPHLWTGPALNKGQPFDLQIAVHPGMGPGGLLWRWDDTSPWSSMTSASSWGAEELAWPNRWSIGHDRDDTGSQPFRGSGLQISGMIASLPPLS